MLLRELARQVVANPEAYEGAFPVAEPPVGETRTASMWEIPGIWGRGLEDLLPHQQALLEHLNRLMTPNHTATGATIMAQNDLHRGSVAQRILDDNRRRVAPWGDRGERDLYPTQTHDAPRRPDYAFGDSSPNRSTFPDFNVPLTNGEPVHRAHCALCNADKLCVTRQADSMAWGAPCIVEVCVDCLNARSRNSYSRLPAGRPFPAMNAPTADLSGAYLTREQFDEARRRVQGVSSSGSPTRSTYPDLSVPIDSGEPVHQAHCRFCNVSKLCVTRQDDGVEREVCSDCLSTRFYNSYNRLPIGSYSTRLVPAREAMMAHAEERGHALAEQAANQSYSRPDHHRVRPGQCSCGFKSAYLADMTEHLADTLVETSDGIPRRWRVCECGESRLCREVVRTPPLPTWNPDQPLSPHGPAIEYTRLCDSCCKRR